MAMVYNLNDTATEVLAQKQAKENIFVALLHRNGKGVNEVTNDLGASTVRFMKVKHSFDDARDLNGSSNKGWFNEKAAKIPEVTEYDLNLTFINDQMYDLPEVQQDLCPVDIFEQATKNIGGNTATEINASTLASQLVPVLNAAQSASDWANLAVVLTGATDDKALEAFYEASSLLDDGDEANGIQSFPFEEREVIMRSQFRRKLFAGTHGVIVGGSNYAQSMIAKGALSPDTAKDFGNMYVGEIDSIPCYLCPTPVWERANKWTDGTDKATAFDKVEAVMCAASATDRGISTLGYIKIIDSPSGAGKRLQPKTRWGINVCYPKGIVPIVTKATPAPSNPLTVKAPGSVA